ncbi:hypothetical protein [Mucilaginibacter sp. BT774]|uniref:hypothetical protein n=1 Tax=Mucilaginibacter sp. BT774 TaxID=3062276 RepID=UPI00267464DD|nr:hypothetical protein [Mucilaginibacter sp. BT774]MDO3624991.1 hypothetical protein [Mucilaginibacter sp. BT774]
MKKIYIGLLLLVVVWSACHNGTGNITNKCGPCPLANELMLLMAMKVRIVDKTTGADLFLSPNSPYKLSDLKVTKLVADPGYNLMVDSLDTNNRFLWLPDGLSQTYTLQLGNLSADHIKVVAGLSSQQCCAFTEVKSIMLNDSLICAPCNNPQQAVLINK